MKLILVSLCLAYVILAEEFYPQLSDDFNVAEVLNNDRLLKSYTMCLLDKGPCTPDVKKLKDNLPEVLATNCAKCSAKHKEVGKQLVQGIKNRKPELWEPLVAKYDPKGQYQQAFKEFLEP